MYLGFMEETEVKILGVNREQIEGKLVSFGASKIFEGDMITLFLDFQGKISSAIDGVLRLRKTQDTVELTYKKVQANKTIKIAQEYTVQVSDLEATLKILEAIGLCVKQRMEKHRVSYKLSDARFDFDCYSGSYGFIPEFLEIEGSVDAIQKYATMLGFTAKDCLPWDTENLVKYYAKKVDRKN